MEDNFNESQKEQAKRVIQKRLQSLGARNIEITATQKNIIANYETGADSILTRQSFQTAGKLEFFEVCNKREILYNYLDKTYTSKENDTVIYIENLIRFLGVIHYNHGLGNDNPIFGYVDAKHKARVEALLIHKKPVFISELKRRVKFLLGKTDKKDQFSLSAVYVTSTNKAPLNGRYIVNASAQEANYRDNYVVDLQMNKEGAAIWERLTGKAYQERGSIAIVIDDLIYSAPLVNSGAITGGRTQVSGNFTKDEATMMASIIGSGELPKLKIIKMETLKETAQSK